MTEKKPVSLHQNTGAKDTGFYLSTCLLSNHYQWRMKAK